MSKSLLTILLIAIFFKQLTWSAFIPLWQFPDEQAHFGQVAFVAETSKLRLSANILNREIHETTVFLGTARDEFGNNRYTYHPKYNVPYTSSLIGANEKEIAQLPSSFRTEFVKREATGYPPLYYLLAAQVYSAFSSGTIFDRVFAIRLFTSLTLIALVGVTYKIGKLVFADSLSPLILATLVGFMPMLTFVHAGVSSDPLFNLLFSLFLYFCLRLLNLGLKWSTILGLILTLLLSFWTKPQAHIMLFILAPVLPFVIVRQTRKDSFAHGVALAAIISTILFFAYRGIISPLLNGRTIIPESNGISLPLSPSPYLEHLQFTLGHTYREVLPWYWGVFRWLSLGLPDPLRSITNWLTAFSFVSLIISWFLALYKRKFSRQFLSVTFLAFAFIIYFTALTVFVFTFRLSHGFSFGIQGRYFFPVIIPVMAVIFHGLTWWVKLPWRKLVSITIALGIIVLSVLVFFYVVDSYYELSWPTFFREVSQYKPIWLKYPVNLFILTLFLASSVFFVFLLSKMIYSTSVANIRKN